MTSVSTGAIAVAAVVALGAASGAVAQEATLRAASFVPGPSAFGWPFVRWVEEVNAQCAGKVRIDILDAGAVSPFELPNAVRAGVVDMASVPPAYYKGILIEADSVVLGNVPMAEQRTNGAWELLNKLHTERMNVHYLTAFGDGVKFHVYTTKPLTGARLDGFRLRTSPNYDSFFRAMGAEPVQLPPPEVYTALERKVVDGYGWPIWGIFDFGWNEQTKYLYQPGFYNVMVNLLVNQARWGALNEEQQGCLSEMALKLEQDWPAWRDEYNERELAKIRDAGIEIVDLGPEFSTAAHDIYWKDLEAASPETVGQLRALLLQE
jgi:TRAP-type C4-dicarboxylate transport system substrate-binding protein